MLRRVTIVLTGALLAACNPAEEAGNEMAGGSEDGASAPAEQEQAQPEAAAPALTRTPAPPDARVYFIEPADGATLSSPVRVVFGLEGAGVAPAGHDLAATGHHHLLIDTGMPPAGQPIPNDDNHRHFGGGETEASISLSPGTHTLQLLFADHLHVPHDPPIASERITIDVQ